MELEENFKNEGSSKKFIKFEVGDGKDIHMRFDRWHPDCALFEKYGF